MWKEGSTLAAAMARHPKVFDELYTNMVEAGETGGILDIILQRVDLHRKDRQTQTRHYLRDDLPECGCATSNRRSGGNHGRRHSAVPADLYRLAWARRAATVADTHRCRDQ